VNSERNPDSTEAQLLGEKVIRGGGEKEDMGWISSPSNGHVPKEGEGGKQSKLRHQP